MKGLLVVCVIGLMQGSYATLVIKGPHEPVLQGEALTLECLVSDPELNTSQVHFEHFSKYQGWYRLDPNMGHFRLHCSYMHLLVEREEHRVVLSIPHATSYWAGSFRCVSDAVNATVSDNSSQLTFKVHYMGELSLYRAGFSRYLGSAKDLRVPPGEDVVLECAASSSEKPDYFWQKEGGDWILPCSKLKLKNVGVLDGGRYTCVAQHPTVSALSKRGTISITVLPEDAPWYESSDGHLILMTSATAVALLVLILSVSVFLCCRAKRTKTRKGPIDDQSQKQPIYKVSVESLPSTCGDKQPLV